MNDSCQRNFATVDGFVRTTCVQDKFECKDNRLNDVKILSSKPISEYAAMERFSSRHNNLHIKYKKHIEK